MCLLLLSKRSVQQTASLFTESAKVSRKRVEDMTAVSCMNSQKQATNLSIPHMMMHATADHHCDFWVVQRGGRRGGGGHVRICS